MTGVDVYNKEFDSRAKKRIEANKDKPFLKGFYYFLLSDGKRSYDGSYNYLNRVIEFCDKQKINNPSKITFDDYTEYLSGAYAGKSPSHQIVTYSALKIFSRYLKAKGICVDDYMSYIKRPKFSESENTKDKREKGYMTRDELKMFLNEIKYSSKEECWKKRDYAMATVLLNTGIRCAELNKLDLDDINFEDQSITVLAKGNKSRKIYLSDSTMNNLKEWIDYRNTVMKGRTDRAVFVSSQRRRITRQTIYNIIKEYGLVINGKNITTHKTRATYGTQLYEATHDIYFVQKSMGHNNPKTTEMYIRGQDAGVAKKASDLMGDILD